VITGANGIATAPAFTANTVSGTFTVVASVTAVGASTRFTLTNVAGAPTSVSVVPGSAQSAQVAHRYGALRVLVSDIYGNPVPGVRVTFSGPSSGSHGVFTRTTTASAVTAANGVATAPTFTANSIAGNFVLTASVAGVNAPASFNLTNLAGPAAKLVLVAGNQQTAAAGQIFAAALQVRVTDAFGNAVSGVSVTFVAPAATGPSGTFAPGNTAQSDQNGVATAPTLTANNHVGNFTVTASIAGRIRPVLFNLTII
jgi:hypothetical protein